MVLKIDLSKISYTRKETPSGKYIFKEQLCNGGEGEMWIVENTVTSDLFALKLVVNCSEKQYTTQRNLWSYLFHENIVTLEEIEWENDILYLIFELCQGDLLTEMSRNKLFSESEARDYFVQLVNAVQFCHGKKISHQDIKLENILFDGERIKLCDFGAAQFLDCFEENNVAGSVSYLPPEFPMDTNEKHSYSHMIAHDIWSLGIVLFAMVTGCFPWRHASQADERFQLFSRTNLISEIIDNRKMSLELQNLLENMLQIEPLNRLSLAQVIAHPWTNAIVVPICEVFDLQDCSAENRTTENVLSPDSVGWFETSSRKRKLSYV